MAFHGSRNLIALTLQNYSQMTAMREYTCLYILDWSKSSPHFWWNQSISLKMVNNNIRFVWWSYRLQLITIISICLSKYDSFAINNLWATLHVCRCKHVMYTRSYSHISKTKLFHCTSYISHVSWRTLKWNAEVGNNGIYFPRPSFCFHIPYAMCLILFFFLTHLQFTRSTLFSPISTRRKKYTLTWNIWELFAVCVCARVALQRAFVRVYQFAKNFHWQFLSKNK